MNEDGAKKTEDQVATHTTLEDSGIVTSDKASGSKRGFFGLSHKKTLVIALLILLFALPWLGAYWVTNFKRTTAENTDQVMQALKQSLSSGTVSTKSGTRLPPYQPSGYTYSVTPLEAESFAYTVQNTKKDGAYNKARRILYLQGLNERTIPDTQPKQTPDKYFENSYVRCALISYDAGNTYRLYVDCGAQKAYDKAATDSKTLYELYATNNPTKSTGVTLTAFDEQASTVKGYGTMSAVALLPSSQEPVPVSFYQTPDKVWHYFASTPALIPCGDFSTDDLKKAYFGTPCYVPGNENAAVTP
jgi:hypothetical protein